MLSCASGFGNTESLGLLNIACVEAALLPSRTLDTQHHNQAMCRHGSWSARAPKSPNAELRYRLECPGYPSPAPSAGSSMQSLACESLLIACGIPRLWKYTWPQPQSGWRPSENESLIPATVPQMPPWSSLHGEDGADARSDRTHGERSQQLLRSPPISQSMLGQSPCRVRALDDVSSTIGPHEPSSWVICHILLHSSTCHVNHTHILEHFSICACHPCAGAMLLYGSKFVG